MRPFKIAQPKTAEELGALLAEAGDKVTIMSGGTDLLDRLKSGVAGPEIVADIQGIEDLSGLAARRDGLRIGPLTRIVELAGNPVVARDYPSLRAAAVSLASPQLRNVGTVGGNLCQRPRCWYFRDPQVVCIKKGGADCFALHGRNRYHAILGGGPCYIVYPSDLAPVLISLGARVTIGGRQSDRVLPLEEFYQPPSVDPEKENVLGRGEYLKDILIPGPRSGRKASYVKLKERETWDFAIASAAVAGLVRAKTFSELTIVLGGVAPVPWRLKKAEDILRGKPLTEALLKQATGQALKEAAPLSENGYKIEFAAEAVSRAVLSLV
jgi:xanthine dehydrogenase YagS FAD-binding subunit